MGEWVCHLEIFELKTYIFGKGRKNKQVRKNIKFEKEKHLY